jgi:hypothetical protein
MKLTDAFERVIVLNLPFKSDRRDRLSKHLEERGLVDPEKVRWQRAWCGDWTGHPAWWSAGNGAWGCLMSHVRACEDAIHDGVANYLILEDDVVFHERASQWLRELMEVLPTDWGQLYLGGQYLHQEPQIVDGTKGRVMRPYNVNRTHAFALTKSAMAPFLRHILHAPDYLGYGKTETGMPMLEGNSYHIDHQLGIAHQRVDWPVYTPTWWLAGQAAGSSNVSAKINPELWWHWRGWGERLPMLLLPADLPITPELRAHLWTGENLIPGTWRDRGASDVFSNPKAMVTGELYRFCEMIAGEAIERWQIPAIQVESPDEAEKIRAAWTNCRDISSRVSADELRHLRDYPATLPLYS